MPAQKKVIIIAGPTAVGKTSVAITVARKLRTEIISADSRQCYKELRIGVARPSEAELAAVPHHFIASHSIHQKVTASTFEAYALEKTAELFVQKDTVVMTGGTGLYIKAFCEGLDEIPGVPDSVRKEVTAAYAQQGLSWLQDQIRQHDPLLYQTGELQNPHRLLRALEVFRATGQPISHFRKGKKAQRAFQVVKLVLELPKEELHQRIHTRVDQMMEQGLENEVRSLIPFQHIKALQTVGYRELFDHFNGLITRSDAVHQVKQNTRQYAKRQLTWFRKDKDYTWLPPDADAVLDALNA